ncbi:MAG: tetratricopeptide repeat protein, partial [Aestuariibacter sp.]|nr:tetratricopeptide repeat protein [Aestuariibacter sp.]
MNSIIRTLLLRLLSLYGFTSTSIRADIYINDYMSSYDAEIEKHESSLASALETLGEDHPQVAEYRKNLVEAWRAKADKYEALGLACTFKSVIKDVGLTRSKTEDNICVNPPSVATEHNTLREDWDSKDDYDKAIRYYELALESELEIYGEEGADVGFRLGTLGDAWFNKGEYGKAIEYYEQALVNSI